MEFLKDDKAFKIYPISEYAVTLEWPSADAFDELIQLAEILRKSSPEGITDLVPSYHTLTVFYQPQLISFHRLITLIRETAVWTPGVDALPSDKRLITIPVCYGGSYGPDLERAASEKGISPETFIEIHSSVTYKVFMLGFLPGFPYMGWVDQRISLPRLDVPRREVRAGSVGIAGLQTGIYPVNSPGGWPIIGQTPLPIFNSALPEPCLLKPGDEVRFMPVSSEVFEQYTK